MMAYTSLFLFCMGNGADKSAEEILSLFHYLFSQYVLITYYLQSRQLLLYIFLNKQEITEIPHLFPQPWPRPGALDNECN